jgi:Tfp pilus assembly protein PilO
MRKHLDASSLIAIALLAGALAFSNAVVKPLEERAAALKSRPAAKSEDGSAAQKVAAVYEFLQRDEEVTDYLAKLHGIGAASGVQLKSATYKTETPEGRIVRTEIVLPVTGSYPHIRDFLKRSLAEIPVLSVDSLNLKKTDQAIQAEMKLTLHMVKS